MGTTNIFDRKSDWKPSKCQARTMTSRFTYLARLGRVANGHKWSGSDNMSSSFTL